MDQAAPRVSWGPWRAMALVGIALMAGFVVLGSVASDVGEAEGEDPTAGAVVMPFDSAEFSTSPALPPGVSQALLRASSETGGVERFLRFPPDMHVPLHWHSSGEWIVVIDGSAVMQLDETRTEMTAGAYAYVPPRAEHEAWIGGEGVVIYQRMGATPDRHLVEKAAK